MLRYIPFILVALLLSCAPSKVSTRLDHPPEIEIIYPHKDQKIGAIDSTFILGNVTTGSKLYINNHRIPVHPEGGFLAFLPIHEGYLCTHTINSLIKFKTGRKTDSEKGLELAKSFVGAGLDIPQELFIEIYDLY